MSVKEIRELDNEVKEISVADDVEDSEEWEEEDVERGEEKKVEEFSIGDTMLARGKFIETWGAKSLEDTISKEDMNEDFQSEDFEEEEEMGESSFSYDASGDDVGELYGRGDAGVGDLYGTTKSSGSGNVYDAGGGGVDEGTLYSVDTGRKKDKMSSLYRVEGPKKKKSLVRRGPRSGLETGIRKKRRSKGVSLY